MARVEKVATPEELVTAVCVPLKVAPELMVAVIVTPSWERFSDPRRSWIEGWVVRGLLVRAKVISVKL
jgi:hypothetical protein